MIARGDSPPTLSKSCSDKLALKQCTSLLSSATSLLVSPGNAYLDTLILPHSRYRPQACERSFGAEGRMNPVATQIWPGGYAFHPFKVDTTELDFKYSRRNAGASPTGETKGCNIAAVWNPHVQETLINGVLQGRKQTDPRGASALSKSRMFSLFSEIQSALEIRNWVGTVAMPDYQTLKKSDALEHRRRVKTEVKEKALRGWSGSSDDNLVNSYLDT